MPILGFLLREVSVYTTKIIAYSDRPTLIVFSVRKNYDQQKKEIKK